jgi:hypothetical protein
MKTITVEEFKRWQEHRVKEHNDELQEIAFKLADSVKKIQKFEARSKRYIDLSIKRKEFVKELLGRFEWALDELEAASSENLDLINELRSIYKLQ